tara:strand:- start:277 stop:1158 length:882 start_codon:yes stop_codon:yes gene_type:complete
MHVSRENVIVRLQGGLGNQLFQYATGKSLSLRLGVQLILDLNWYTDNSNFKFILDRFQIYDSSWAPSKKIPRRIRNILYKLSERISTIGLTLPVLKDIDFEFNHELLTIHRPVLLDGYWQNESYFIEYREQLLQLFEIKGEIDKCNNQLLNKIKNSNSICIHIRRGDYITNTNAARINGVCSKDYYYRALNHLSMHIDSPTCYVFSDEPHWAKSNLEFDCETFFVDINGMEKPEFDFLLMKSCKYFIIANSTFSWWAAWLSNYKHKKVIAPKVWFLNSILNTNMQLPESWLRI